MSKNVCGDLIFQNKSSAYFIIFQFKNFPRLGLKVNIGGFTKGMVEFNKENILSHLIYI